MGKELESIFSEVCEIIEKHNATDNILRVTARKDRESVTVGGDGSASLDGEEVVIVHLLENGTTVQDPEQDVPSLPNKLISNLKILSSGWEFYGIDEGGTGSVEIARKTEVPIGEDNGEVLRKEY